MASAAVAMASAALSSPRVITTPTHSLLQSSCRSPTNVSILEHLAAFPRLKASRISWKNESSTIASGKRQPIATPYALTPPDVLIAEQPWRNQSLCKCGCTRRWMLTFLGGATIANEMAGNIARCRGLQLERRWEKIAGYKRELFSRLNDNVKTVLELGIGTGPKLAYDGGRPSIANVIGVDPNEKMARHAAGAAVAAGLTPDQFKFLHAISDYSHLVKSCLLHLLLDPSICMQAHLGDKKLKELINFALHYIADLDFPIKRGTFVEFHMGLLNVSPIGCNCSREERDEFERSDKVHNVRKTFVELLLVLD